MSASNAPVRPARELRGRYGVEDLAVFSQEEARRFVRPGSDPRRDLALAFELLYRLEPELYERLAAAERIHPGVLSWLPGHVDRVVEVGAGTGRLTVELARRASELVAVEPAAPLREILERRLAAVGTSCSARVVAGFFDEMPLPDGWADLVVSCSAFTPDTGHGGEAGLAELERVCRAGGCVALVWPNEIGWLIERGYSYVSFAGEPFVEFGSGEEGKEMIEIFYPDASPELRSRLVASADHGGPVRASYEELGLNAPRDIAFKVIER